MTIPTATDNDEPFANSKTPDNPIITHTRVGESRTRIWMSATMPLILHFLFVLVVISFLKIYVNKHDFNVQSRYALSNFTPLQSDITTIISSGIAICRFFAGMWSAATVWRCIFILMEKGGISLEQIDSLLTWQVHIHSCRKSSQEYGVLVFIILLAAFPAQLSGPIVTGSITWSASHRLTEGEGVTGINAGYIGDWSILNYSSFPANMSTGDMAGITVASGFAGTAWQASLEDERTMKRFIGSISHLPINSTLDNVTLPYFAVSKLEWIRDPKRELSEMRAFVENYTDFNPLNLYPGMPGVFAFIPDGNWGSMTIPSPYTGIISETRTIVGIYAYPPDPSIFGDLPANIGIIPTFVGKLIYGRVTYVAGAAECRDCRVSSWGTVQNDTDLTVSRCIETAPAIRMMPMVGSMMRLQNNSLPRPYNNLDRYVTELLIRSYAASWVYNRWMIGRWISSEVKIAIPTLRATVLWWRVWLWLWLNLLFTLSGVLFCFSQQKSGLRLVGSPSLAALLLDTSEILHEQDRAFCNFSTLTKDDKEIGYLQFMRKGSHVHVDIAAEN